MLHPYCKVLQTSSLALLLQPFFLKNLFIQMTDVKFALDSNFYFFANTLEMFTKAL